MEAESRSDALDYLAYDMYVAMFEKHKLLTRVDKLNDITAQLRKGKSLLMTLLSGVKAQPRLSR
jgi:hypothetical protein